MRFQFLNFQGSMEDSRGSPSRWVTIFLSLFLEIFFKGDDWTALAKEDEVVRRSEIGILIKIFLKYFVSHFLPFSKFSFMYGIPSWYYQVLDTLKFLEPGLTVKTFSYIRLHPSLSSLYSFPNGPSSRKWTTWNFSNQMRFSNSHPCVTCVLVH